MFPLKNKVQNYDWGKLGTESKAAKLCNEGSLSVDQSKPYAELWMGTHPNAPSLLATGKELKSIITAETCSPDVFKEYGDLPFLFKVLSIRKALSIQAHPDKELAQRLHKERPDLYKDPNHKPEMAIALTDFEAFINFRPLQEIHDYLIKYPEFADLVGAAGEDFKKGYQTDGKRVLKGLFAAMQNASQDRINELVPKLISRVESSEEFMDQLLVRLNGQYPNDVGLFCALVLNYVKLKPGEAIFLAANEPHAYLSGDCVECMAASDNVVRSGLTPKFKDVKTLVDMLTYNYGPAESQILLGTMISTYTREYNPPIKEFTIHQTKLNNQTETMKGLKGPSILIVTEGKGVIATQDEKLDCKSGSCYFIGADVPITLTGSDLVTYRAFCTI
jgi:mannose-6-phosphate isomerase